MDGFFYSSRRTFQIWSYDVSHSMLLLRSPASDRDNEQVDIVFKGVDFISIPTRIRDMVIEKSSADFSHLPIEPHVLSARHLYEVAGSGARGLIAAAAVYMDARRCEYFEESELLKVLKLGGLSEDELANSY